MSASRRGYLYVAAAAILFGFSGAASKFLFNIGLTPFELVQLRTTIAFTGLFLYLLVRNRSLMRISVGDFFPLIVLGVLGLAAAQFFTLFAISRINVSAALLLHYTGPVFVAVYAAIVLGRRLSLAGVLSILGTLAGCFLVVEAYHLNVLAMNKAGVLGGLAAAVAFAVYSILCEYEMRTKSPWTILFYGLLFAALTWNILQPPFSALMRGYAPAEWWWILFVGIGGTTLPFGLYFEGIKQINSTHASITATLEPVTAAAIAMIFLGEGMGLLQMVCCGSLCCWSVPLF